jgi:hypothetical protein
VTSVQAIAAGIVGLAEQGERRVFPRWVSYWAILAGVSFLVLTAMPFYKTGPIAWNGAISFWERASSFPRLQPSCPFRCWLSCSAYLKFRRLAGLL